MGCRLMVTVLSGANRSASSRSTVSYRLNNSSELAWSGILAQSGESFNACRKSVRLTRFQLRMAFRDAIGGWLVKLILHVMKLWSDMMPAGSTLSSVTIWSSRVYIWSRVPPQVCVGPTTCWTQSKLASRSSSRLALLSSLFSTWMLKSPATMIWHLYSAIVSR